VIVPDPPGPLPFLPLREQRSTQGELTVRTPEGPTIDETIGGLVHGVGHDATATCAPHLGATSPSSPPWSVIGARSARR
jgi:hypothetical protein